MRNGLQSLLRSRPVLLQFFLVLLLTVFSLVFSSNISAQPATLTVTPITWNIIGLDSNRPADGPRLFPVGARVCTDIDVTNLTVSFDWLSTNALINLRPGSLDEITIPALLGGTCIDAYFEVEVTGVAAAYNTTRRYVITATDGTSTATSPTPRELFVERLVSQNRNATTNIRFGTTPANLTSVAPGGTMNLLVGNTYIIELTGSTATQGYEQLETFLSLSNTIFRILSVNTTYTANTSPYVPNPNNRLYADACLWENDPNSPNYRSCLDSSKKTGGTIVTTYTVQIIGGGGTTQALNSLIYDFSGSSYHYNSDFGVSARFASIIDPTSVNITKQFAPSTTNEGGISTLIFTLTNPNSGTLSGYNFVDNLPSGVQVANPPMASTSGCGTPSFSPAAGAMSISFSNGTVAGNGTCTISVNVTAATDGIYTNTTQNLFLDTIDTGQIATADLTVTDAPPPPACTPGLQLARWEFPIGSSATNPVPTSSTVSASAAAGPGVSSRVFINSLTATAGTGSWEADNIATGASLNLGGNQYFEFSIDTTGMQSVTLNFSAQRTAQGAQNIQLYYGMTSPGTASDVYSLGSQGTWIAFGPTTLTTGLNPSGQTNFRLYVYNAGVTNNGHSIYLDNVTFTGCGTPQQPTLTKAFSPNVIAANGVSTLTFTLTNPNALALTNATFSDTLPTGMVVATPPTASSTCGGTWSPTSGSSGLNFSGGTIPANSSCTVQVNVTTAVMGPSTNVSGFISTTETGQNSSGTGSASASLMVIAPPQIGKQFAPNPILAGGVSTLTFTIVNPNQNNAISGVAFDDTFPLGMVVAPTPNATTSGCGSPTFSPTAGSTSISFSGGSIAAGGTCTAAVNVTVSVVGDYINTSGSVSHIVNSQTVNGNSASDTLTANPPSPGITLLKQVGLNTVNAPWLSYLALPEGQSLYYLLTIENTGDVPLTGITVTDPNVDTSGCSWRDPLPVASASNDDHIDFCLVGPVIAQAGVHTNTAVASGTYNSVAYTDQDSATYATTGLTLVKAANPMSYSGAGETINYTFTVTNTGSAILSGPVVIDDDLTTNEFCPPLSSIGNGDNFFDPGEVINCTANYVTTASDVAAGSITNTASASAGGASSSDSSVTVNGPVPTIDANDDDFSATPINGLTGGTTVTVYTNDTLNGSPFLPSAVQPSIVDDGGLTGVSINPADGTLSIPAGTPANTYVVTYQICQSSIPTNCDTALVTIVIIAAVIDANDDNFSGTPINGAAGGTTASVYDNDTLNGVAFAPADVTPSIVDDGGLTGVSINPADGTLTIPAGTPAGTYIVTYQICETLNPTNCDPAQVTIVVAASAIIANDDDFSGTPIDGAAGGSTATVYTNDTLDGSPFAPSAVQPSVTDDGGLTGVTIDPADGTLTIPAGTPANTYVVTYEICEVLNPTNCDPAQVTIVVAASTIIANDDDFSATPINGAAGGTTATVYGNDTFNGILVTPGQVTPSITDDGGLTGVSITPADGTLNVPAATPAGTYTVTYQICEVLNPTNCDTAVVTIVVNAATIVANDDDFSGTPINGLTGGTTVTVYTNDTLDGIAFTPDQVQPSIVDNGGLTGVSINSADGTLTIPAGTPAGTYTVTYQICEVLNPSNCDPAVVTIVISAATIVANDDDFSGTPINGAAGGTTATVYTNDTLNGVAFAPAAVQPSITDDGGLTGVTINPTDGTLTIPAGTPAGSYTVTYQICETLNPTNCDTAQVAIVVAAATIIANDDDFSATPINGAAGGTTAAVYTNDTLDGIAVNPGDVTPSLVDDGGLTGVTINPMDGTLTIPAGMPANTYVVTYEICEVLNPSNCDTAVVTIVISAATIVANDDDFSGTPINGAAGGTTATVYTNDTLNGSPFAPTAVQPSIVDDGGLTGVSINPDGTLSIPGGTTANTYIVTYQICETLNPTNCDPAQVTIVVAASTIIANDDDFSATPINGAAGGTTASVYDNDTLDGSPFSPADVTPSIVDDGGLPGVSINPADGTLSIPPNTPAGTYTVTYQICETSVPTNCDTAQVTIVVAGVPGTADLAMDKRVSVVNTAEPTRLNVDDILEYTVTVMNAGPENATNVVLEDGLSTHFEFVTITGGTMAAMCSHDGTNPGGIITCNVPAIAASTSLTLTYNVRVASLPASQGEVITNIAEVMASDQPDPNSTPGNGAPDEDDYIRVDLPWIFDPPFGVKTNNNGNPALMWSMVWYNPTPVDATNVTIIDPILPGTTYVGPVTCQAFGTSVTTRCEYDAGTNSIVWQGTISGTAPNTSIDDNRVEISFVVDVESGIQELNNVATLTIPDFGAEGFTTQVSSQWSFGIVSPPSEPTATPQSLLTPEELDRLELPETGEAADWRSSVRWIIGAGLVLITSVIGWLLIGRKLMRRLSMHR